MVRPAQPGEIARRISDYEYPHGKPGGGPADAGSRALAGASGPGRADGSCRYFGRGPT